MPYRYTVASRVYIFEDLKTLLAKATPLRSGDALAGLAAEGFEERIAAQLALADLPLKTFLNEAVIPYEEDDITRLIFDEHDRADPVGMPHEPADQPAGLHFPQLDFAVVFAREQKLAVGRQRERFRCRGNIGNDLDREFARSALGP